MADTECYGVVRGVLKDRASKDWGMSKASEVNAHGMSGFCLEFLHLESS